MIGSRVVQVSRLGKSALFVGAFAATPLTVVLPAATPVWLLLGLRSSARGPARRMAVHGANRRADLVMPE